MKKYVLFWKLLNTTRATCFYKAAKRMPIRFLIRTQILDTPWFIVTTNLENTFFYNKETKTSIWVPTQELEIVLAKMGQVATEKLEAERRAKEEEEQERLKALKRPNDAAEAGQEGEKRSKNDSEVANTGTEYATADDYDVCIFDVLLE